MSPTVIDATVLVACITSLAGIITTIITGVIALVQNRKIRAKNEEIEGYHLPFKIPDTAKRNSILLIALGGVGKTTLIKTLLQNEEADPTEKTEKFDIYRGIRSTKREGSQQQEKNYWFHIADYKGQNVGQLVRSFIVQQKKPFSPFAYGYIDSLIIMVDLWPPNLNPNDPDPLPQPSFDLERVNKHLKEWNDTALDAIFGLLTDELKYVCLFINKVDLMSIRTVEAEASYIGIFCELEERLKKRSGSKRFDIILGSALDGTGTNMLEARLMEHSVSSDRSH